MHSGEKTVSKKNSAAARSSTSGVRWNSFPMRKSRPSGFLFRVRGCRLARHRTAGICTETKCEPRRGEGWPRGTAVSVATERVGHGARGRDRAGGEAQRPRRRDHRRRGRRHERARGRPRPLVRGPHGTATVFSAGADLSAGTGQPTERGGEVGPRPAAAHQAAHRRGRGVRGRRRHGAGALVRPGGGVDRCDVRPSRGQAGADGRLRRAVPGHARPAAQRRPRRCSSPATGSPPSGPSAWGSSTCSPSRGGHASGGDRAGRADLRQRAAARCRRRSGSPTRCSGRVRTAAWASSDRRHWALVDTEDCTEGIAAFFERRPPEWKNR